MNQVITPSTVQEFLLRHLEEVFSTMLSLSVVPQPETSLSDLKNRVSGSVGFAGAAVTGSVFLHLPAPLPERVAAAMLGLPAGETPADSDVNDVVGEVTNMLAGGLKSWLCDAGAACALTTPAIIRGNSFQILSSEGVTCVQFGFACDGHPGSVEVHIKFGH